MLKYNIAIILSVFIVSFSFFQIVVAQNNSSNTVNTFEDPKTGISFQYPSDWEMTSQEYNEAIDKANDEMFNTLTDQLSDETTKALVNMLPKTLNGAMLGVITELLPIPMTSEKFMELSRQTFTKMGMGDVITSETIPISIGNLNGHKYDLTFPETSITQTQMGFVKDSKGFLIFYNLGETEQSKNIEDINLMINSFKIK